VNGFLEKALSLFDGGAGFVTVTRFLLPVLAVWILVRCVRSVLSFRYEPETWGSIRLPDGSTQSLCHWECVLGRSRFSDVVVNAPDVSRTHAVLRRSAAGVWTVTDAGSAGGTWANGKRVEGSTELPDAAELRLGGTRLRFSAASGEELSRQGEEREAPGRRIRPGITFLLLSFFLFILAGQHAVAGGEHSAAVTLAFLALGAVMWAYFFVMRAIRRTGFEAEALGFFLTGLGLSVAASSVPGTMFKQLALILAGLALFLLLGWWLRSPGRTRALRWPAALAALGFLALNLLLSEEVFGARNWLTVGGFSLQPSEFVKIAYVYAGAAGLDRLYRRRNLFLFIAFSAVCVGALALMGDFGTALVFFVTFLAISFLRSGNLATVFLAVAGAGLAGFLAATVKPHIAQRFAAWGHVWADVNGAGYQQTRAMSAAASGGLLGMGAGRGWLHGVVAADTDLVFGVLCEELGLIVAVCAVLAVLALAAFAVRAAAQGRSAYTVIAACAATVMLVVQLGLNVFGSMDLLPFTGVTFPFVSRGGSSLIACWALLAFVKSADTRQGASFVVRPPERYRARGERKKRNADAGGEEQT